MSEALPPNLTVDDYHRMIAAGILTEEDRVELLEGYLVKRVRQTPERAVAIGLMMDALRARLPNGWHPRRTSAITTSDSEPEPDIAVVRNDPRSYVARQPSPDDVAIVVEVIDAAVKQTRDIKERVYARAMIGEFWLVSLVERELVLFREPSGPAARVPHFKSIVHYALSEAVPLVLGQHKIADIPVRELLP